MKKYVHIKNCFNNHLMPVIQETKTMLVTEHYRFKKKADLKSGDIVDKVPYERWSLTAFTYIEKDGE